MRPDSKLGGLLALLVISAACGSSKTPFTDGGSKDGGTGGGDDSAANGDARSDAADSSWPQFGGNDAGMDSGCSVTCASAGPNCGPINNGCGGILQCGSCPANQTCGGGGMASVCGTPCTPKTCAGLGYDCGPAGDGCGNQLNCGTCTAPNTCGGGGMASVCGDTVMCVPKTCAGLGYNCGPAGDGCGNSLNCGTCTAPDTCGGGGQASVCGAPVCVPKTCASFGPATCGPQASGCGELLQCGGCSPPKTCGGVTPGQCGVPSTCTNLCLQQVTCANPAVTTTVSGTVYAPNGVDPLPNVLVYVPNSPVLAFTPGVACEPCSAGVTGSPLVSAATDTFGKFTLRNVPVGSNIPLVIQTGRWRRQVTIPGVASCMNTAIPASLTNLPATKAMGDIPHMAFATGSVDVLECVLRKIGVADSEFTQPSGNGRINLYVGDGSVHVPGPGGGTYNLGGANEGVGTPSETTLVDTPATLAQYDMVLFPCKGDEYQRTTAQQQNIIAYAGAGGRIFTTHFSYAWLFDDAPFSGTATWNVNQCDPFTTVSCFIQQGYPPDQAGILNTSFPKGLALAQWLQNIGASSTFGQIPINTLRWDLATVVPPAEEWMQINDAQIGMVPMHYTFNTPVASPPSQQCGRVLFDDFHVENHGYIDQGSAYGLTFPAECATGPMTPQEKLLEFMIFDLGSCVAPDVPVCTPTTCAAQGIQCGPAGDGCGNLLQCGPCTAPATCGGGGQSSVCGTPTCTPRTCAAQGIQCGPAGDGCGNLLQCGPCTAPATCGGGGMAGICGAGSCTPITCASQNLQCGPAGDGCGNALNCGSCPTGQTCGGGGMPGVCGSTCIPKTCGQLGYNCGVAGDGCGNQLNCGTCAAPQTCGGGGMANVCGGGVPQ